MIVVQTKQEPKKTHFKFYSVSSRYSCVPRVYCTLKKIVYSERNDTFHLVLFKRRSNALKCEKELG